MNKDTTLVELFIISGIFGVISELFATVQTSYFILLTLLVIDTATGMFLAFKNRNFCSRGLFKFTKKVIIYTTSILTVRLLEVGIISLYETTLLSQITAAYLIITESVSIIENLILLGAPLPSNFINYLLGHLKMPILSESLEIQRGNEAGISEINDIMKFQIPTFENKQIRRLLEIKFTVWKSIIHQMNVSIKEKDVTNNEVLYYKVMSLIEMGIKEIQDEWRESGIPKDYINEFEKIHKSKLEKILKKVKSICYSEKTILEKKDELIESAVVLLYQTIIDAHKSMN